MFHRDGKHAEFQAHLDRGLSEFGKFPRATANEHGRRIVAGSAWKDNLYYTSLLVVDDAGRWEKGLLHPQVH